MAEEAEYIEAWQCIGCGRVEAARPCVGVCQDRPVRLVDAAAYQAEWIAAREAEEKLERAEALLRRLAATRPRAEAWRASFESFQAEARRFLADRP